MKVTVKIEGLSTFDDALGELTKASARAVLRRVGLKALGPVAEKARQLAPVDEGHLRDSIGVGTKLTRRQAQLNRKAIRSGAAEKSFVEVYAGAGGLPQAALREFGGDGNPPAPYMRPAWEQHKDGVLETVQRELGAEIDKAAKRAAAKAARLARKAAG